MSGPSIDPALYRPRDVIRIRRALVSVSDKSDLVEIKNKAGLLGITGQADPRCDRRIRSRNRRQVLCPGRIEA